MLIVLNDNEMSISPTVGAISQYLPRSSCRARGAAPSASTTDSMQRLPLVGPGLEDWSRRLRKSVVNFAQPGQLFEDLGITYVGPVPGHNLRALDSTFRRAPARHGRPGHRARPHPEGPRLPPAEADKVSFHGAALPPMTVVPAAAAARRRHVAERRRWRRDAVRWPQARRGAQEAAQLHRGRGRRADRHRPRDDPRIVAITAGMPTGTGLAKFQAEFPDGCTTSASPSSTR